MKANMPISWYDTIDSTNSEARRRAADIDKMAVFAARFQTAGRGQRGNRWSSSAGENLTFSILVKFVSAGMPEVNVKDQFILSVASALAVSDYLGNLGLDVRIKWPNDIYVRDRKICGMLIENSVSGTGIASSIVGIGLNLNQTEFPPELVNPTSVAAASGLRIAPEKALEDFLEFFMRRFSMLHDEAGFYSLRTEYESMMYRIGKCGRYHDCIRGNDFEGKIKGISEEGMLLMEMPDESIEKFAFKEVSYII